MNYKIERPIYLKTLIKIDDETYIRCIIPFDKTVVKSKQQNVGLNVGLNKTEKAILASLIENSDYTADELAEKLGVTKRTIERTFASLQNKRKLERIGSKRDGRWIVIG